MLSGKELDSLALAGLLYETVTDPSQRQAFLNAFTELTASSSASFYTHDLFLRMPVSGWHTGCSSGAPEGFESYYNRVSPWIPKSDPGAPTGTFSCLCLHRSDAQKAHSPEAITLATRMVPHVLRTTGSAGNPERVTAFDVAIDRSAWALVFVDADARILEMTPKARQILDMRNGAWIERGKLYANAAPASPGLQAFIREASQIVKPLDAPSEGCLRVPRANPSLRDLLLFVAPIQHSRYKTPKPGWITVQIVDPEAIPTNGLGRVVRLFGLSHSEAQLLAALAATGDLKAAAEQLRKSYETVRTQLKAIFEKTQAKGQAELLALIARLDQSSSD